ncbi:hypothetical protein Btru_001885 [Bulinus truncatus]|nr:hypothetical protein Btru_001885 [Bulinus truncatus]
MTGTQLDLCPPLTCVDPVPQQGGHCPYCPNGDNCYVENVGLILPVNEVHTMDDGTLCSCEFGQLTAFCVAPPELYV